MERLLTIVKVVKADQINSSTSDSYVDSRLKISIEFEKNAKNVNKK